MPQLDGFTLAQHIRRDNATVPILFLTARTQLADVVRGFAVGGQHYLKKPFSMEELIVRIHARLLPAAAPATRPSEVVLGLYQFDTVRQQLCWQGQTRGLTHREAALLQRFYEQRNQVLSRSAILQELWGDDSFFNGRSLDVFISRLRRYLQDDPRIQLVNVRGIGYKLVL